MMLTAGYILQTLIQNQENTCFFSFPNFRLPAARWRNPRNPYIPLFFHVSIVTTLLIVPIFSFVPTFSFIRSFRQMTVVLTYLFWNQRQFLAHGSMLRRENGLLLSCLAGGFYALNSRICNKTYSEPLKKCTLILWRSRWLPLQFHLKSSQYTMLGQWPCKLVYLSHYLKRILKFPFFDQSAPLEYKSMQEGARL